MGWQSPGGAVGWQSPGRAVGDADPPPLVAQGASDPDPTRHFVYKPASVFIGHYVHALYFMFEMGGHYTDIYYAFQTF